MPTKKTTRRKFIKLAAASGAAAGFSPAVLTSKHETLSAERKPISPNDRIRLATFGMGIIGFIDTDTALRVPGVEFVACADCYTSRLDRAKEVYGADLFTTQDYREILSRSDVDAVIVSVPDHWHARMAVEAMEAGKDIYLEKPMVQDLEEGPLVIDAQRRTNGIVQVGSQFKSDILYEKAKELYESGAIGSLNMVEARYNRHSSLGAWQYSIPPNVTEEDIDWEMFLGDAPQRPFDPVRFFRWRNYWDYGTGIPGDLFVHLFTGIHHVLSSNGPVKAISEGGLRFWHDGRDVPDVMLAIYEYDETDTHPEFSIAMQSNFADGSGGGTSFSFIGSEGVIEVTGSGLKLTQSPLRDPSRQALIEGYNSVRTWSEPVRAAFERHHREEFPAAPTSPRLSEVHEFSAPAGYDARYDHFVDFFDGVRDRKPTVEDAVVGYRAAAPALMANLSLREGKIYHWDPNAMRVVS